MGGNQLTGQIPTWLGDLKYLEELYLDDNQLTGTIPPALGGLSELEELSLSGNQLTGCVPISLKEALEDFGELNLPFCESPDRAALVALYHATNGDNWHEDENWLTDAPLDDWHGVKTDENGLVVELELEYNNLTGELPTELGSLTALEFLFIEDNSLWGEVPHTLIALNRLIAIGFGGNSGLCAPPEPAFQQWLHNIEYEGPTCVRPSSPPDYREIAALTALYNATDGDNWRDSTNWLSERPLQYWKGVYINSEGRIIKLRLTRNKLSGPIPSQIGDLKNLQRLELYGNQLSGVIPPELGNLTDLQRLNLSINQLSGAIPSELSELAYLQDLSIHRNRLSGAIPPELGNLANLEQLSLSENQLTGAIPSELGNLANLEELLVFENQLSGAIPQELTNLTELEWLYLGDNQLSGVIPPELGNLTELRWLDLRNNRLTGAIPPELVNLTKLEELFLARNQLTGCIPDDLRDVEDNDFDELNLPFCSQQSSAFDECIQEISSLPYQSHGIGVENLWSSECESANKPGSYARFYTLTLHHPFDVTITLTSQQNSYLYLMGGIGANGLVLHENDDYEGANSRLQVSLQPGNYTIEATTQDAGATGLFLLEVEVDVWGPTPRPTALTDRAALTALYHSANGDDWNDGANWLTDAPLSEWHGVETDVSGRVTRLDLEANNLVGELPLEFGNLDQLKWVNISLNQLTGELSRGLTNLTMLEYFYFDNNAGLCAPDYDAFQEWAQSLEDFRGDACAPLPPNTERDTLITLYYATRGDNWRYHTNWLTGAPLGEWHGVTTDSDGRVIELNLGENNLSGHVPPELGNLPDLTYLTLSGNDLSGEIPAELAKLTELEDLSLGFNRLSGGIPAELGYLTELESLDLLGNNLSGGIPAELGNLTELEYLDLLGNNLSGEIPAELGNLISLEALRLNDNQLTGHIPSELGNLAELEYMELSHNQLNGEIPVELGNLAELIWLDLHTNQLGGEIPASLGDMTGLRGLFLNGNQLTGETPAELGNLDFLYELRLNDNRLTGALPRTLTQLEHLNEITFHNNAGLCAPADAAFQEWLQSVDNVQGDICGTVPPDIYTAIPAHCMDSLDDGASTGVWTDECLSLNRTENGLHYARYYTFSIDRRTTVELTLESRTDPYLMLLSETGDILAQDDDDDEGAFDLISRNSGIRIVLGPGNYIVETTTYAGTATGEFTLTFRRSELEALQALYNATTGDSHDRR